MEKINVSGVLTLKAYKKGALIWEKTDHNLIVNGGYNAILSCLKGDTGFDISKVKVGQDETGAHVEDTELLAPIELSITSKTIIGNKLVIEFVFGESVGNGTVWGEFGLFTTNGTLFSRKAWNPFTKISDLTLNGTWEINI